MSDSLSGPASLPKLLPLDARVPSWSAPDLQTRLCPFCDTIGRPMWERPDALVVERCPTCECFFVSPSPSEAALGKFYSSYFTQHSSLPKATDAWSRALRRTSPYLDVRVRELSSMVQFSGLRVLDVGCGRGEFLFRVGQLGAECRGVELDPTAAKVARDQLDLAGVANGDISAIPAGEEFDLISLNDVIEHPLHPGGLLQSVVERLTPGGYLSVWTPSAPASGEVCPVAFRVDLEHMQYLSLRTVALIANRFDLEIVHLEQLGEADLTGLDSEPSVRFRIRRVIVAWLRSATRSSKFATLPFELHHARMRSGRYNLFVVYRRRY